MQKEVVSRRVKVTEDTTVSRLSLIDQVKLLIEIERTGTGFA